MDAECFWCFGVLVFATLMETSWNAAAVERGSSGFYLLGGKRSLAGMLPPTGTYLAVDRYFYSGDISTTESLSTVGGELEFGLDADVFLILVSAIHVPELEVLNGRLAFGAVVPVVHQDLSADLTLDFEGAVIGGSENDKATARPWFIPTAGRTLYLVLTSPWAVLP